MHATRCTRLSFLAAFLMAVAGTQVELVFGAVGGLIAYSLAVAPDFQDRGTSAVIPEADYASLRQRMVLLKRASPTAAQLDAYVLSGAARAIFLKHGYAVPQ